MRLRRPNEYEKKKYMREKLNSGKKNKTITKTTITEHIHFLPVLKKATTATVTEMVRAEN